VFGMTKALHLRAGFASGDQAMLVYDLEFQDPIGSCPTANLMTFQDGLIRTIELFYDARPFAHLASAQTAASS
jgi:hypothetical protein